MISLLDKTIDKAWFALSTARAHKHNQGCIMNEFKAQLAQAYGDQLTYITTRLMSHHMQTSQLLVSEFAESDAATNIPLHYSMMNLFEQRYQIAEEYAYLKKKQTEKLKDITLSNLWASNHNKAHKAVLMKIMYDYPLIGYFTSESQSLVDRLEDGIALINLAAISNYEYYEGHIDDSINCLVSMFLLELRKSGVRCLQTAIETSQRFQLKSSPMIRELVFLHELMARVYFELIRTIRELFVNHAQHDVPEVEDVFKSMIQRSRRMIHELMPVYELGVTVLTNSFDRVMISMAREQIQYSVVKCRLLHAMIGIKCMVVLYDDGNVQTAEQLALKQLEFMDDEDKELVSYITILLERWKLMSGPLKMLSDRSILHVSIEGLSDVSDESQDVIGMEEKLFWTEKLLVCTEMNLEARDYLVGSFHRIGTSYPFLIPEKEVYEEIFKESESRIHNHYKTVLDQATDGEVNVLCRQEVDDIIIALGKSVKERALTVINNSK